MRLDWWQFNYEDVITIENVQGKLSADPKGPDIRRTDSGQLQGVSTNFVNAASVETDGIDFSADWNIPASKRGDFGSRLLYSHFLSAEIPDGNGRTGDVVGSFNHDKCVCSMPKQIWNLIADWERGHYGAAMVIYYLDSYKTGRAVPASAQAFGFNSGIGN